MRDRPRVKLAYLMDETMMKLVSDNSLKNCNVWPEDVRNDETIFSPKHQSLRGKKTRENLSMCKVTRSVS